MPQALITWEMQEIMFDKHIFGMLIILKPNKIPVFLPISRKQPSKGGSVMHNSSNRMLMQNRNAQKGLCETCNHLFIDEASGTDHCFRFARFVDHVINEATRNCDYWQSACVADNARGCQ